MLAVSMLVFPALCAIAAMARGGPFARTICSNCG